MIRTFYHPELGELSFSDKLLKSGHVIPQGAVELSGKPSDLHHWDDNKKTWVEDIKQPRRLGTPREFLRLLTSAERLAFWAAESKSPSLKDWWADASTGDFSLDHPRVETGLSAFVSANIITKERKAEIMQADFNNAV